MGPQRKGLSHHNGHTSVFDHVNDVIVICWKWVSQLFSCREAVLMTMWLHIHIPKIVPMHANTCFASSRFAEVSHQQRIRQILHYGDAGKLCRDPTFKLVSLHDESFSCHSAITVLPYRRLCARRPWVSEPILHVLESRQESRWQMHFVPGKTMSKHIKNSIKHDRRVWLHELL